MQYNFNVTETDRQLLQDQGYLILRGLIQPAFLAELRERTEELLALEGSNAGSEFKKEPGAIRLANLVDKGEVFERVVSHPVVLEAMAALLGQNFKLSSLNYRSTNPHSTEAQPLHSDTGAIADEYGYWVANSVWLLDDFTADNGATRFVAGTHKLAQLPENPQEPHVDEQLLIGKAGDVAIMNAHMWHGGTANRTAFPRRALHGFYTRFDKPQQQYQKQLLRAETIVRLSPELRKILALDDPLNDTLSSAQTGMSGFLK